MKKKILCLLSALLAAGLLTTTAYGAEAAVTLKSAESIPEGDSFSVALIYQSPEVALHSAAVEASYDEELLEYRSMSGGEGFGEDGVVRIRLNHEDGSDTLTCKIRFRAISQGESFVTVTTASLEDVNGADVTAQTRSAKVIVTEPVSKPEIGAEKNEPAAVPETGEEEDPSMMERILSKAADYADRVRVWVGGLSQEEFLLVSMGASAAVLVAVVLIGRRKKK